MRLKEFAEKMDISVRTAISWLKDGRVPGAHKINPDDRIPYWQIPVSSIALIQRPKSGPARGTPSPRKGKQQSKKESGKGRSD